MLPVDRQAHRPTRAGWGGPALGPRDGFDAHPRHRPRPADHGLWRHRRGRAAPAYVASGTIKTSGVALGDLPAR
jgi:hypothetical protein